MTREEAIKCLRDMMGGMPFDKCFDWIDACSVAIQSLEAWDEVMKDVQDWQDDFNAHVECLRLTDAEKEETMMYGQDVVNIIGNHMVELKDVEPQLPPLDIRDCDHCKHYVTRDGQTGCEKWECEFEKEE